jgi:hypothetical protein
MFHTASPGVHLAHLMFQNVTLMFLSAVLITLAITFYHLILPIFHDGLLGPKMHHYLQLNIVATQNHELHFFSNRKLCYAITLAY